MDLWERRRDFLEERSCLLDLTLLTTLTGNTTISGHLNGFVILYLYGSLVWDVIFFPAIGPLRIFYKLINHD